MREANHSDAPKPRLLDRVRAAIRARHYSRRTEDAYAAWIRRFIVFHGKRHPSEMGAPEITQFLTWLAVDGKVASSTQNQAPCCSCTGPCSGRRCRGSTVSCGRAGRNDCLSSSRLTRCGRCSRGSTTPSA